MRNYFPAGLIVGGVAAVMTLAQPAMAQEDLSWSFAYGTVKYCSAANDCAANPGALVDLASAVDYGSNMNAGIGISPSTYSGVTSSNYGGVFALADPGAGGLIDLPILRAYASGAFVNGTPGTYSWNFASAQGVQGFLNSSETALVIPINAFVGYADFNNSGSGTGIVSAALALTTSAIENETIGNQWFRYNSNPGFVGQFAASCATAGAIALGNPGQVQVVGAGGSGSISVTPTSCLDGGADSFTLNPGESFYMWSRLSAFRATFGITNAANTFTVSLNPDLSPEFQRTLAGSLAHITGLNISTAVPEPTSWTLMIFGFGGVGAMVRRRRTSGEAFSRNTAPS